MRLVRPAEGYRDTFLAGLAELRAEGLPWYSGPAYADVDTDFSGFVARLLAQAKEGAPPKTQLWAIVDERFAGRIGIHHALTDALRREGGHVGYDTVPSFRRRGVATAMLRAALPVARELGLDEVLMTCDDTNAGSIRVIEANGGVLRATTVLDPARPAKRYYTLAIPRDSPARSPTSR